MEQIEEKLNNLKNEDKVYFKKLKKNFFIKYLETQYNLDLQHKKEKMGTGASFECQKRSPFMHG